MSETISSETSCGHQGVLDIGVYDISVSCILVLDGVAFDILILDILDLGHFTPSD
jgi:hypothetical protein